MTVLSDFSCIEICLWSWLKLTSFHLECLRYFWSLNFGHLDKCQEATKLRQKTDKNWNPYRAGKNQGFFWEHYFESRIWACHNVQLFFWILGLNKQTYIHAWHTLWTWKGFQFDGISLWNIFKCLQMVLQKVFLV